MNLITTFYFVVFTLCSPVGTTCKTQEFLAGDTLQQCMKNAWFRVVAESARTGWTVKGPVHCVSGTPS